MLQIQNLCKTFHKNTVNEKVVFQNFSLRIQKGDFITIIGSNGAGKSTLLNLISGSLEADEGQVFLKGSDIGKEPEYKRCRWIGRVFQDPYKSTAPSMTIIENLSMAQNKKKPFNLTPGVTSSLIPQWRETLASLALGLEDQMNTKVGLLSGGQRQALALVMATMAEPDILLLDEHTASLDPKTSERIVELTENIIAQQQITTLMVTHNLNHAISMGNRLLMLHKGEILFDIQGEEKQQLTMEKLFHYFEEAQSEDLVSDRLLFS